MKILTAFLLSFFFCISTQGQYVDTVVEYFNDKWEVINPETSVYQYVRIAKKTKDGLWHAKNYYSHTKTLQMEGLFIDDSLIVMDGVVNYYYPNGMLKTTGSYYKNIKVGLWRSYNDRGLLIDSARYKSTGIPFHKAYKWYYTGALAFYGAYDMNGSGAGIETEYYPDNTISSYGKYVIGYIKDSIWTYYYKNKIPSMKMYYQAGQLLKVECFDTSGALQREECNEFSLPMPVVDLESHLEKHNGVKSVYLIYNAPDFSLEALINEQGQMIKREMKVYSKTNFTEVTKIALQAIDDIQLWNPAKDHNRPVEGCFEMRGKFEVDRRGYIYIRLKK